MIRHLALLACLATAASMANGQIPNGMWTLQKSANFHNRKIEPPKFSAITVTDGLVKFSNDCSMRVHEAVYQYDLPFQLYLKSGVDDAAMTSFLKDKLNFNLHRNKTYFHGDDEKFCSDFNPDIFVDGNRFVVSDGSSNFFEFVNKSNSEDPEGQSVSEYISGIKISQLPVNLDEVEQSCLPTFIIKIPAPSSKCAPRTYVNIATKSSKDRLSKLVGAYNYLKQSGQTGKFSAPVASGLHPAFIVFPPKGDVILVRVYDIEQTPDDPGYLFATYIAIKGGKVTDQLDDRCFFNTQYSCEGGGYSDKKQLNADEKFVRIK